MSHIIIGLCTDHSDWISSFIRWLGWTNYSHSVLVSPDGTRFIEATHGKPMRCLPIYEFLPRDRAALRQIEHPNPDEVWAIGEAWVKEKRRYDWRFSWGWLFRMHLQDPDAFACHEWILVAAARAGKSLAAGSFDRLTPDYLYAISEDLTAGDAP